MAIDEHPDFTNFKLGQDHAPVEVDTSAAISSACAALFSQASREILIMSRDLDPRILDNAPVVEALRQFLISSRRVRMRVLVKDADAVARSGHRVVELAQRLSSFAEIRVPAAEFDSYNSAFIVVDATGVIHRQLANRFEATIAFNDRLLATETQRQFDEMWQTSTTAPSLRRMSL